MKRFRCNLYLSHTWLNSESLSDLPAGIESELFIAIYVTGPDEDLDTGMLGLAPKLVRLAPNGTNPGLFQIVFQYI